MGHVWYGSMRHALDYMCVKLESSKFTSLAEIYNLMHGVSQTPQAFCVSIFAQAFRGLNSKQVLDLSDNLKIQVTFKKCIMKKVYSIL